jgi:hypothetical protein
MKGLGVMNPPNFSKDGFFCRTGVTILDRSLKGEGNYRKVDFAQRSCSKT